MVLVATMELEVLDLEEVADATTDETDDPVTGVVSLAPEQRRTTMSEVEGHSAVAQSSVGVL